METWLPEDKLWLQQRKKSWKPIKKELQKTDGIEREDIKRYERYYLTGKEKEPYYLHLKLWFHPDQSEENWQRIIKKTTAQCFKESRCVFGTLGAIGGLEERLIKIFYPETDPTASFDFNGTQLESFLTKQPYLFVKGWWNGIRDWLILPEANPFAGKQYMLEHMYGCLPYINPTSIISGGRTPYPSITKVLTQCAHFVEPRGLPGEDTQPKRFVEKLRHLLNTREFPEFIHEIWEQVQTREGRSKEWVQLVKGYQFGSDWEEAPDDEQGYFAFVVHNDSPRPDFFISLHRIYQQLGFVAAPFNADEIESVDLGRHLSPEMFPRLGYKQGENVPAYRYRLKTNCEYVDSDEARIDIDLLMPKLPTSFDCKEDTPVFFLVSRPEQAYYKSGGIAYRLNERMVRRIFKKEIGLDLLRYIYISWKIRDEDKADPFYKVKYQPFVSGRKALDLTNPECEFPKWLGEPLPPIFPESKEEQ